MKNFRALTSPFSALFIVSALSIGCGLENTTGEAGSAQILTGNPNEEPGSVGRAALQQLKSELIQAATTWTQELDEPAAKALFLENYYDQFVELGEDIPFATAQQLTVGSWREVWASEENDEVLPGFIQPTPGQVYQVIKEDGVGFNIGVNRVGFGPVGANGTFFIELTTQSDFENELTLVEFINTYQKLGTIDNEPSLAALVGGILDGSRVRNGLFGRGDIFQGDQSRTFPNGPIGAKGTLKTIYIDADLRIVEGPNAFQPEVTDYFVLVRQDTPLVTD